VVAGSSTVLGSVAAVVPCPSRRRTGGAALRPLLSPGEAVLQRVCGASSSSLVKGLADPNFVVPKPAASSSSWTEK